jgi:membrane protein implicated in regulation of membrane protease activity
MISFLINLFATNSSTDNSLITAWLVASFVLLVLELSFPGLFLFISFSAACLAAAFITYFGYATTVVWGAFFFTLFCSFALLKPFAKKQNKSHSTKTNTEGLLGQVALVIEPIKENLPGRIKVKGEEWPAIAKDSHIEIEKNTRVIITAVRGNKAIVQLHKD